MTKKKEIEWKDARQNLLKTLKKFPNLAIDVIDSAYLAGLEARDCSELKKVIKDIFWMARRYAHGRHTYAPSIVRDAWKKCVELGMHFEKDLTIEPPADFKEGAIFLRADYLDDIN